MTTLAASTSGEIDAPSPIMLEPQHWLAALAMLFVLFAPYQTLVQTVIIDDEIRLGVEVDSYDMIWVNVAYLVGFHLRSLRGHGLVRSDRKARYARHGLLVFCLGNVLCGAATGLFSLAFGRFVEGFGKLMLMAVGRATLYKQFDRALMVAIGFYGVFAYSTRYWTPLINAYIDVYLSWRWTYWAYVPISLIAIGTRLVFLPTRPAAATGATAARLAGDHRLRGLDHRDRFRVLVVPQMGRMVFERVCRMRRPVRGVAAGSGSVVGVGPESRRTSEARPRLTCVRAKP